MILLAIILTLVTGSILAAVGGRIHRRVPLYISLFSQLIALGLAVWIFNIEGQTFTRSVYDFNVPWISIAGANFHLSIDGLSLLLVVFTLSMGIIGTITSISISEPGFFHFNFLLLLAGISGIFMAADLLLFFFFWELMLVPMFFLMIKYQTSSGKENVPFKFLWYTQISGLIMLAGILALYFIHGRQTQIYSFELADLSGVVLPLPLSMLLMLSFALAFLVKLSVIPFHGWMPDTFSYSPLAVILTGILVKTGAYGILRFSIPLFPEASILFAPTAMAIGVITILYCGFIAFSSTDIRRIAAYSSISHTGFILVGLYAFNILSWQGVVFQMIASAISVGGLAILAHVLYYRTHTYDISQIGGLWSKTPILSGFGLFISLALLGLPGLANFVAEFLILAGTFQQSIVVTILASLGIVVAAAYSLRIVQKIYVGPYRASNEISELTFRGKFLMGILVIALLVLGVYTRPVTRITEKVLEQTLTVEPGQSIPQSSDAASVKMILNPQNK